MDVYGLYATKVIIRLFWKDNFFDIPLTRRRRRRRRSKMCLRMPILWRKYNRGLRNMEGEHLLGFSEHGFPRIVNTDRAIRFTTKQLLTCGVVGGTLLCCGAVFALPYLAKLIK